MPEVRFRQDDSFDNYARIDALLRSPRSCATRKGRQTTRTTTDGTSREEAEGRPISGWVIFDKPKGMGSTEAVSKIKWLYFAQKAGHAGTLDPLASGMLPIALGDATKTVPFVMDGQKTYRFTVSWGAETTTDDTEGPGGQRLRPPAVARRHRGVLPNYTARFPRCRPPSRRSRSRASAPTIWPAPARPWRSPRAP